jgi:hypothetical protein
MKTYRAWPAAVLVLPILAGCGKSTPSEPDAFVTQFSKDVAAGDLGSAWNYLPPKYQSDVKGLITEAASNLDAEVYDKGFALTGKVALLLKSKKDFLLKSDASVQMPKEQKDKLDANWQSLVDAVETLSNSDIKTLDGLKKVDPGAFLASTGNKLFAIAKTSDPNAEKEIDKLKNFKATVVKRDGDTATLKIEMDGKPAKEEVFKQVEGKWLPKAMVDDWDADMAKAKSKLADLKLSPEMKPKVLEVIKLADTSLDRLLAAKDQETFNKEMNELQGAIMGVVMSAMMGGGGGPPIEFSPGTGPGGLPGGAFPGPGVPPGLPGGVPLGTGGAAPTLPGSTPAVPALPK